MNNELQRIITRNALQEADAARLSTDYTYHVRPGSSTSAVSQRVETSPAYLLEWDSTGCDQTFLATADELRSALDAGRSATAYGRVGGRRLFVLHGLPAAFLMAIRSAVDIDPAFVEAHAGRRRYRPLRWRKEARFACYEYPELVRGYRGGSRRRAKGTMGSSGEAGSSNGDGTDIGSGRAETRDFVDLLAGPVIKSVVEEDGGIAAVFCHASLWVTDHADVLFLDRPTWRDPASPLRKARRQSSVTKPYSIQAGSNVSEQSLSALDVKLADGDEILSLEDTLQESLKDAMDAGDELTAILSELSYNHWVELLELLTPKLHQAPYDTVTFYWHMLQCLEQNVDTATYLNRFSRTTVIAHPDWAGLLTRIQTRISLLPLVPNAAPISLSTLSTATSKTSAGINSSSNKKIGRHTAFNSSAGTSQRGSQKPSSADENQRALDRVSYLGGILIPLPIVSGILSMGDTFGPQGSMFYVFWAVSIPLAALTVLIIYADTLRKAEVWVEIAAEQVAAATGQQTGSGSKLHDKVQVVPVGIDIDHTETVKLKPIQENGALPSGEQVPNGVVMPRMNQAITFDLGHEEAVIDLPATGGIVDDAKIQDELSDEPLEEPEMILERPVNGSKPKAWKRQQLGWYGAAKLICGYKKPRNAQDVPLGVVAYDKRQGQGMGRRQTRTF